MEKEMSKQYLTNFYVFQNRMVIAFDQYGKQIPELQGHCDEKREALLEILKNSRQPITAVFNAKYQHINLPLKQIDTKK